VFQSPVTGAPYDATTLWRKWRLAADEAGLGAADGDVRVRFHDLRRGFTSRAARRHGLPVAMRLSRHRSLKSVEPYINVDDRELEAAYAEMEDEVRRGPRPVADEPAEDTNEENRQR
jgi:integrase